MAVEAATFGWFWSTSGKWYAFWSGFGSDLAELAILGVVWRRLNCHAGGCYRLGLHRVPGTPYVVCRRHHPDVPTAGASADEISASAATNAKGGD